MKQLTQLKYLMAYYLRHHVIELNEDMLEEEFIDTAANNIQDRMPTADIETIRPFIIDNRVNEWIPLGEAIDETLHPAEEDEDREPTEEELAEQQAKYEAEFCMVTYTIELGHYAQVGEVFDSFAEAQQKADRLDLRTYEIKEHRYRFPNYRKGDRVRIYSYELGEFYGTIAQDSSITGGPGGRSALVHIDGQKPWTARWIHNRHLLPETYKGEYALERLADPRLTS